jgi:hypothetical protein
MMKKLLVFMFVLALVSSANASIVTLRASDQPLCTHNPPGISGARDVYAGDVVVVTITADTAVTSYTLSIKETTTSLAGHSTASAGSLHANFDLTRTNGTVRNGLTTAPTSATQRYMLIDKISGGKKTTTAQVPIGEVLYQFELMIPTAAVMCETFTITAVTGTPNFGGAGYTHNLNAVAVATTNALVLHVIPEPMTIALLGLGGLFMLRRRR